MSEHEPGEEEYAGEIIDAHPVLAEVHEIELEGRHHAALVRNAAVAATGFFAGAATAAVLGRQLQRQGKRLGRPRTVPAPDVLTTRTYLVNVHLLGRQQD